MRRATMDDIRTVARMAMEAHVEAGEGGDPDPFAAHEVATYAIERGAVFMSGRGCLAGHVIASPIAPTWRIACEIFWRVEERQTVEMLRAFSRWAIGRADEVRVGSAAAARAAVERRMRMEGFTYRGAAYGRRL